MATLRAQPGATLQVLGWDEAFIGVQDEDPEAYARQLQKAVLERTRLHCSIPNGRSPLRSRASSRPGVPSGVVSREVGDAVA